MKYNAVILITLVLVCGLILSCSEKTDLCENPVEYTGPAITLISPANNALIADLVEIEIEASDNKGIYKVEIYVDGDKVARIPAPPYNYIWDASGLTHGSGHSIFAEAFDTDGNVTSTPPIICNIDTALATPEPVLLYAAQNITTTSISLAWAQSVTNDFEKYVLWYDLNLAGQYYGEEIEIFSQSDTTYEVTGLFDSTQYRFQIQVVDINDNSSYSNVEFIKTLNAPPPQSEIISVIRYNDKLSLMWTQPNILDFSSYELIRSADQIYDLSDELLATIDQIDIDTYDYMTTDTSAFYFMVLVKDQGGLSSVSQAYDVHQYFPQFALSYDGNSYCTVPFFSELDVGESYTLEAWVYQTAKSDFMRVIDKSPVGNPYLQYSLISDEYLGADLCGDGLPKRFHANVGIPLNEWHHLALAYNNGTIIYYIDGSLVDSNQTSISTTCSYPTTLNIGRRKQFDEFYFQGIIDEVRVWNVVRTPGEIASAYNVALNGNVIGLVCRYGFDEGEGQVIASPVGGDGYLGEDAGADIKDPTWVESTAPLVY